MTTTTLITGLLGMAIVYAIGFLLILRLNNQTVGHFTKDLISRIMGCHNKHEGKEI